MWTYDFWLGVLPLHHAGNDYCSVSRELLNASSGPILYGRLFEVSPINIRRDFGEMNEFH